MESHLQCLPAELQLMVYAYLDYQTLILVSSTNRFFNESVNPRLLSDTNDQLQFVMRAARTFAQHRPRDKANDHSPGNFECYVCFRVRSPDCFDALQAASIYVDSKNYVVGGRLPTKDDKLIIPRRFCIDCGVLTGLHEPLDCLTTKTGRDLWICRCRGVWPKPAILRCPKCGGDCPLRPKRKMSPTQSTDDESRTLKADEYLPKRKVARVSSQERNERRHTSCKR